MSYYGWGIIQGAVEKWCINSHRDNGLLLGHTEIYTYVWVSQNKWLYLYTYGAPEIRHYFNRELWNGRRVSKAGRQTGRQAGRAPLEDAISTERGQLVRREFYEQSMVLKRES